MSKGKSWFWSQLGIIVNISNLFQCQQLHSWVIINTALISKGPVKICFFYKKQLNPFTTKGILPASMIQGFILPKVISWLFLIINWELKKIPKGRYSWVPICFTSTISLIEQEEDVGKNWESIRQVSFIERTV